MVAKFSSCLLLPIFFFLTLFSCNESEEIHLPENLDSEQAFASRSEIVVAEDQGLIDALSSKQFMSNANNARSSEDLLNSLLGKSALRSVDTVSGRINYTISLAATKSKSINLIVSKLEDSFSFFLVSFLPKSGVFPENPADFAGQVKLSFLDGSNQQSLTIDPSTRVSCKTSVVVVTDKWLVTTTVGGYSSSYYETDYTTVHFA